MQARKLHGVKKRHYTLEEAAEQNDLSYLIFRSLGVDSLRG